jgi:transcriptional regulator with XRE-family HTH domain
VRTSTPIRRASSASVIPDSRRAMAICVCISVASLTERVIISTEALYAPAMTRQALPTTKVPHFATLLVMALSPEQVGARIRKARRAKGWTHDELARRMGKNTRTIQRWQKGRNPENGKSWLPRLATLMELADELEVPRSYFVEIDETLPTQEDLAAQLEMLAQEVAELRDELRQRDDDTDGS